MTRRSRARVAVLGASLWTLAGTGCGSGDETPDITGTWRIVEISQNGSPIYSATTAPSLVELDFAAGGVAQRITTQVGSGRADTTAMAYRQSPTEMTVIAPGETVVYGYSFSEDGSTLTFTNTEAGHVLLLERR